MPISIQELEARLGRTLHAVEHELLGAADWMEEVLHLFHAPGTDLSGMKLGAKKMSARFPKLAEVQKGITLPQQPDASRGWSVKVTSWGMMLNNLLGCCVITNGGHEIMLWTVWGAGLVVPLDSDIQQNYEEVAGYNPADPSTDQGTDPYAFYQAWLTKGFPVTVNGTQTRHKLSAVTQVNGDDINEVQYSVNTFACVGTALSLPISAQTQDVWDVVGDGKTGDSAPGSWGGHEVPIVDYNKIGPVCVTWGALKQMTWNFLQTYVEVINAAVSTDFLTATGQNVDDLGLAQLIADEEQLQA